MPFSPQTSRLRLRTIIRLRWVAVLGQSLTVLLVHYILGFQLPLTTCFIIIGLSAGLNIYLRAKYPATQSLKAPYAFMMLSYDLLQLCALLYLSGGLQNPFVFFMIVPITISASTQHWKYTIALGFMAIICATILAFSIYPLPWTTQEQLTFPLLYRFGVWVAVVCGLVFTGIYSWRIAKETKQMSDALTATEMVLANEQKLSAIDGLAAAAAHELGTPLGTISVVAKELQKEFDKDSDLYEDVLLIKTQADRCKEILQTLVQNSDEPDAMYAHLPLSHLIEEVVEIHRVFEKNVKVSANPTSRASEAARNEPILARNPGILYGLGNIVENAVDFAETEIIIVAQWNDEHVTIKIYDDGKGFPSSVLERLGEPFVTTRSGQNLNRETLNKNSSAREGLGLGYFIAKTLLERSNAKILLSNRKPPYKGAKVEVTWLRSEIDFQWQDEKSRNN